MINEAVGIAINGREVKIAHLRRDKYRLAVDYLESAVLNRDMDFELRKKAEGGAEATLLQNEEDLFALKSSYETKAPSDKDSSYRENVDAIYSLLRKFAGKRVKVAFNVPPSQVSYQDLDTHLDYNKNVFKGTLKKKIEQWKQGFNAIDNVSVIARKDGTLCNVACEVKEPPILDILEQLNTFFKGNLVLSLMDPNEVSLVNLAGNSYDFHDGVQLTVVIQIEMEFSRIIFMKGDDIFTVSPIIPESYNPDIFGILYSKIIYELDNLNLPEVNNVLLAGKASTNTAKAFFEKKFPDSKVGFIISQPLAENFSTQFSREDLSEYAIPISLAWKVLQKKEENFVPTNLLPSQVIERQKVLSLTLVGYLILVLLGISAFVTTWKITAKKLEVSSLKTSNKTLVERINSSEETVKKVRELEDQIAKISKRLVLSDSLSYGSDRLLSFLEKLNSSVSYIKSAWVDEIQSTKDGVVIKGLSMKRGDIPTLSDELGRARINKLTRFDEGSQRLYSFEMAIDWKNELYPSDFKNKTGTSSIPALTADANSTNPVPANSSEWGTSTTVTQSVIAEENVSSNHQAATVQQAPTNQSTIKNDRLTSNQRTATNELETKLSQKREKSQPLNIEKKTDIAPYESTALKNEASGALNSNSRYIIKINAHASKFTAMKDVEYYRSHGFDAYITTLPNSSQEIPFWVCVGDYNNYSDAENELSRLNSSIPGKRLIIEISNSDFNKPMSSSSGTNSISTSKTPGSQLIKKANHTMVANESTPEEKGLSTESGLYTISLSAHATKFTAQKDAEFYQSRGIDAYIATLPGSSREIPYWVCFGKFSSYAEAQEKTKALADIAARNYKIVPINQ